MEQPFGVVFAVAFVALEVSLVSFLPSEPVAVRNLYFCSTILIGKKKTAEAKSLGDAKRVI